MKRYINAVYGDDIKNALAKIRELDRVSSGKAKCKICNCTISFDNIFVFFPESGDVKYICCAPDCMSKSNYLTRQ